MYGDLLPFEEQGELAGFYECNSDTPNMFPALRYSKSGEIQKKLDGLLEWLCSLLSYPAIRASS